MAHLQAMFEIWTKLIKFEPSYDVMRFMQTANFRRVCVCVCVCVGAHSWEIFMCEPIWLKIWDTIDTPLKLWGRKLFFEKVIFH